MLRNRFFRRFYTKYLVEIDQTKIVYLLSLVVGLLSALAAGILKNAIHYTNKILTEGITPESGSYFYLAYPVIGMFITLLFVRYIVKDNIGHGVSRVLYAISKKKSRLRSHNTWTSLIAIFLIAEITGGYSLRKTDAWNLPVLDKGFYVGFLSKSRVYATYRELLIQVSEE
jgi:H+/Cl- antiporter ClcA